MSTPIESPTVAFTPSSPISRSSSSSPVSESSSSSSLVSERSLPEAKKEVAELTAAFGESSATAWLEPRYDIWRGSKHSREQPAIQGYVAQDGWCLAWGNPLCSDEDLAATAKEFVEWATNQKLSILWCCVDGPLEAVLASIGYSTLTCIKEDVIDPTIVQLDNKDLKHNLRRAKKAGITITEVTGKLTEEERTEIEQGLELWKQGRDGVQVASASLQPWLDEEHRRYWAARTSDNKIVGVAILASLKDKSYQIKSSTAFPGAPKGTSEDLNATIINKLREEGSHCITFGVSASDSMKPVHNLGGWKITWLAKAYGGIIKSTGLTNRSAYRKKFNVHEDTMYVCYPASGLGWTGIRALMKMLSRTH